MNLILRPEAIAELSSSALWYDDQRRGLGHDLINEAWEVIGRIRATPESFGRFEFYSGRDEVRRARLSRFPYSVIFLVEPQCIRILAFAPHKRRPLYWLNRLRVEGT
jgi:toxin ParE1/3/4